MCFIEALQWAVSFILTSQNCASFIAYSLIERNKSQPSALSSSHLTAIFGDDYRMLSLRNLASRTLGQYVVG